MYFIKNNLNDTKIFRYTFLIILLLYNPDVSVPLKRSKT